MCLQFLLIQIWEWFVCKDIITTSTKNLSLRIQNEWMDLLSLLYCSIRLRSGGWFGHWIMFCLFWQLSQNVLVHYPSTLRSRIFLNVRRKYSSPQLRIHTHTELGFFLCLKTSLFPSVWYKFNLASKVGSTESYTRSRKVFFREYYLKMTIIPKL